MSNDSRFYKFPNFIEGTTFGVSCDAFANLKEILTRHKPMVADYLDKNYDRVRPDRQPYLLALRKITNSGALLVFCILYHSHPLK